MPARKKILFVCLGNACRSAMAEKIANALHADRFAADSAGTHAALPDIGMDAPTVMVMNEIHVEIGGHRPKSVDAVSGRFDAVINMSPLDNAALQARCPGIRADAWRRWEVTDPRGKAVSIYRDVRDRLRALIDADPLASVR